MPDRRSAGIIPAAQDFSGDANKTVRSSISGGVAISLERRQ
jgi:hypothetical protein